MEWNLFFILNSVLLGIGLSMDAFSISIANALNESHMKKRRMCFVSGIYAFFQFLGWLCVHTIVEYFKHFEKLVPWIALILLLYIGGKMIWEGVRGKEETESAVKLTFATLLIQGIATSIDALSVGFTIAEYNLPMAVIASLIIALVTFAVCMTGLLIGKKVGDKLGSKATIVGGIILVGIGIEIFVEGLFFTTV